jgi:hypothetical protein
VAHIGYGTETGRELAPQILAFGNGKIMIFQMVSESFYYGARLCRLKMLLAIELSPLREKLIFDPGIAKH